MISKFEKGDRNGEENVCFVKKRGLNCKWKTNKRKLNLTC